MGLMHSRLWLRLISEELRLGLGVNPFLLNGVKEYFCTVILTNICFTLTGILSHCHKKLMGEISLLPLDR